MKPTVPRLSFANCESYELCMRFTSSESSCSSGFTRRPEGFCSRSRDRPHVRHSESGEEEDNHPPEDIEPRLRRNPGFDLPGVGGSNPLASFFDPLTSSL